MMSTKMQDGSHRRDLMDYLPKVGTPLTSHEVEHWHETLDQIMEIDLRMAMVAERMRDLLPRGGVFDRMRGDLAKDIEAAMDRRRRCEALRAQLTLQMEGQQ